MQDFVPIPQKGGLLPKPPLEVSLAFCDPELGQSFAAGQSVASLVAPTPAPGRPASYPPLSWSSPRLAAPRNPKPLALGAGIGGMGSSASRAQPVPNPAGPPGTEPDQNWDALKRLKHSRSAMWTDEMARIVEHNLRHNRDLAPRPNENRCKWDIRVDATYDYYYPVMVKWLSTPLPPTQAPGQKQREHHPPKSGQPPEERGQHQPQEHPEGYHGGDSTYQGVDRFMGTGTRHGRQGGRTRASRPVGRGPMAQGRLPGSPGWPRERRKPPAR